MEIHKIEDAIRRVALSLRNKDILAVGLFGSLARGDFDDSSDIDIFIITEEEIPLREQDELYFAFSELISRLRRDVTVLVYDINSLKRIPTWQTLNLVKDGRFVYDRAEIKKIFEQILRKAEEHGIVYNDQEKIFSLKKPERTLFSLS